MNGAKTKLIPAIAMPSDQEVLETLPPKRPRSSGAAEEIPTEAEAVNIIGELLKKNMALIASDIFMRLGGYDLRSARLVCHNWNDHIRTELLDHKRNRARLREQVVRSWRAESCQPVLLRLREPTSNLRGSCGPSPGKRVEDIHSDGEHLFVAYSLRSDASRIGSESIFGRNTNSTGLMLGCVQVYSASTYREVKCLDIGVHRSPVQLQSNKDLLVVLAPKEGAIIFSKRASLKRIHAIDGRDFRRMRMVRNSIFIATSREIRLYSVAQDHRRLPCGVYQETTKTPWKFSRHQLFDLDQNHLALSTRGNLGVEIWSVEETTKIRSIPTNNEMGKLRIDGNYLFLAYHQDIRIWDITCATDECLKALTLSCNDFWVSSGMLAAEIQGVEWLKIRRKNCANWDDELEVYEDALANDHDIYPSLLDTEGKGTNESISIVVWSVRELIDSESLPKPLQVIPREGQTLPCLDLNWKSVAFAQSFPIVEVRDFWLRPPED